MIIMREDQAMALRLKKSTVPHTLDLQFIVGSENYGTLVAREYPIKPTYTIFVRIEQFNSIMIQIDS